LQRRIQASGRLADNQYMDARGTWLCPTDVDRERLLDMEPRIDKTRRVMFACLGVGLLSAIPWLGWFTLAPLAWVVASYPLLRPWITRSSRPEYPIMVTVLNAQLTVGIAIAFTGGPQSPALPFLLLAIVTVSARFSSRGVFTGIVLTTLVMLGSTVGVDPGGYADDPTLVNACLVALIGLGAGSYTLMHSDMRQRTRAVLDPLTGLLNRRALLDRFAELAEQAALTDESVALVACDLDHFKAVNDEHGHERGDAVLKDTAYVIRRSLRSFELVYRMGGEEFLIVLPGADAAVASTLAETVRAAVEEASPGGLPVTISMGVAAAQGSDLVFETLCRESDEALYRAKGAGRNRVRTLEPEPALLTV
jgi:diguanylate cyclase (GGDEF)-like protein